MSIVTSLLHANYKENLMTRFSANKQNGTYVSLILKKLRFVLLTCFLPLFGDQRVKGFREKGKWNRGIKNCVQPP